MEYSPAFMHNPRMNRPAVFFDRDNTLIANDGYLGSPAAVVLVGGAADAVARLRALGYAVVVFSNQSGVARGMFSEEAVHAVNARMDELLLDQNRGAVIDRHEFCPFHPDAADERYRLDSELRKPRPGMLLQASEKLGLDLSQSWVVGDAPRDIAAGRAAGCRTILFRGPGLAGSPAAAEPFDVEPDFIVASLQEAADVIAAHTAVAPPPQTIPSAEEPPPQALSSDVEGGVVTPIPATEAVAPPPLIDPQTLAESPVGLPAAAVEEQAPQAPPAPVAGASQAADHPRHTLTTARLEKLTHQILDEMRRHREQPEADFSVSKLLAGIVQVLALAALFLAYINRSYATEILLVAIFLQTFTIALLIMGKQR